tara:strand:+ start:713 stop:1027 length:315 start_codon:yes stop_codon:yes gene_type:complete
MEWTDEMVEVFTQIYSSNYSAGCVRKFEEKYKVELNYSDFAGRKFNEKLENFRSIVRKYIEGNPNGLEFVEEKYCGEVEIWKKDNKTYEVPIDVHRDFSSMVEV